MNHRIGARLGFRRIGIWIVGRRVSLCRSLDTRLRRTTNQTSLCLGEAKPGDREINKENIPTRTGIATFPMLTRTEYALKKISLTSSIIQLARRLTNQHHHQAQQLQFHLSVPASVQPPFFATGDGYPHQATAE